MTVEGTQLQLAMTGQQDQHQAGIHVPTGVTSGAVPWLLAAATPSSEALHSCALDAEDNLRVGRRSIATRSLGLG